MQDVPARALDSSPARPSPRDQRPFDASPARSCLSDRDLVDDIVNGDRSAFAEVHRRHHARVVAIAASVCDLQSAEEITQDVFLRLWTRPRRFDALRGSLGRFLSLEAHDRAVDLVRSRASRLARERRATMLDLRCGIDPETDALERERAARLRRALLRLPRCEYDVIVLAYFDQRSYRQVAVLLDQPEGTVKARIRNGMARLRSCLDDDLRM